MESKSQPWWACHCGSWSWARSKTCASCGAKPSKADAAWLEKHHKEQRSFVNSQHSSKLYEKRVSLLAESDQQLANKLTTSLNVQFHSVTWGLIGWTAEARKSFNEHGFVVINNVLDSNQCSAVLTDCECAAKDIVGPGRAGNRGYGRYSFGVASSSGAMLHCESFAQHLLNGGCSKLQPLLVQIFEGGKEYGFLCTGAGGDFVVGGTDTDQFLHADIQVQKKQDLWLAPPMVSINFAVQDISCLNGPMRIIPGTQLHRGDVPDQIPQQWQRSCLSPVPAGAAIVRDVRVLHSGTRNVTETVRYLPSVELVSADFRSTDRRDCFPLKRCLPIEQFQRMHPQIQKICAEIVLYKNEKIWPSYSMS